ncbi:MAG: methyl-accepting chemotaxis protein [Nitrospinae bacterium]|nr:methyl-accepting chemotaxis protein [Nitrospinota bacterium]
MFKNFSIKKKFIVLFGVILLISIFSGINSYRALTGIRGNWDFYQRQVAKRQELLMAIKAQFGYGGAIHNFKNIVLRGEQKFADRFNTNYESLTNTIKQYLSLENLSNEERQSLLIIQETANKYRGGVATAQDLHKSGSPISDIDKAVKIDDSPALKSFDVLNSVYNSLTEEQGKILSSSLRTAFTATLIGLLIAFVIILLFGTSISRSITKPLNRVMGVLEKVSQGDMREKAEVNSTDEIGALSQYTNILVDKLHGIMSKIITAAQSVTSASRQMSTTADDISKTISSQSEHVTHVAASMEEMSATIVEVAKNTSDASTSARHAMEAAESGNKIVMEGINSTNNIAKVVMESTRMVENLGANSQKIGEIIKVIDDIADQTNLLALNAAIEAARAGEHGRGFAVVADEVRKLAEKTTKATKEIADMIKAIQMNTEETVKSMEAGRKEVESGVELSKKIGDSLQDIIKSVKTVTDMINQIATASEEQATASEEVSGNMETISNAVRQFSTDAQQSAEVAKGLSQQAMVLGDLVGQFKL